MEQGGTAARTVEKDLDGYAMKLVGKLLRHLGILTVAKRTGSGAREYRPDGEQLKTLMEAVDRLRQKASDVLHNPTFSLKKQAVVEQPSSGHALLQDVASQVAQAPALVVTPFKQFAVELPAHSDCDANWLPINGHSKAGARTG